MTVYPKKFVGLHSHSTFSIGDAIGFPQDHIDFALQNGMDALALTDHGNMNGYSHQFFHGKRLRDKGQKFKTLPGIEAYFVDSLEQWQKLYNADLETKRLQKAAKKGDEDAMAKLEEMGDPYAATKDEMGKLFGDDEGGAVVENEEESKSNKYRDPIKQRNHLVLLPKNSEGLQALFELVSESYTKGFYFYPRVDIDLLKKFAKGNIIALTACIAGVPARKIFDRQTEPNWENWGPNMLAFEEIQKDLKETADMFKWALGEENYYLELQFNKLGAQHLVNQHLIECSKRTKTPLVVTVDAHYSHPEHWKQREIYKMMAWASRGMEMDKDKLPSKLDDLKCELYPKNADQVWKSYKDYTADKGWDFYDDKLIAEAIERTHVIAHEQIGNPLPNTSVKLPTIARIVDRDALQKLHDELGDSTDEDKLAFAELKRQAIEGLKKRKMADKQEYIERLKHELRVIKHLKFSKYFLTYSKIMEVVSEHMLIGNARGSAGGSLLSYVLNITQLDPIKHGLLFERFLTRFKKGFPDIDSDFADREKAVSLIAKHFGEENVIPISNFNQLQLRSLIKDLCRLNNVPFDEVNQFTRKIENEAISEAKKTPGFDAQQWTLTYEEAEEKSPTFRDLMKKFPDLEENIKILFRQMRVVSRHAGGVIITEKPECSMPLIYGKGRVVQTPWQEGLNFRHLEGFGLLKFDILGLGTLRMFENCIRRILKNQGVKSPTFRQINKWFYENLHSDNNQLDDQEVYKNVYWNGRWAGVFQFVQPPVQQFIQKMKPTNIIDIATATSIFRPGPLGIGADKMYLNNRSNPAKVSYKHPLLKEVLAETSGLIVFQEQLQLIYHKLAGVPLEETDDVRKSFTKKDKSNKEEADKHRREMREDFADRCLKVNNIPKHTSYEIFDEMEKFVAYSFNKSHATAYAITSYQCAWLLTHYPDEWIATYIDYSATEKGTVTGKESPISIALGEAKSLGYKIGKPDVNVSDVDYQVKNKTLIPSFRALKHVGIPALSEIKEFRPYTSIEDILWNPDETWRHSKLNRKALGTLVMLEAFDSLNVVGEDKPFKNYKQMYHVLVDNNEEFKRACARKKKPRPKELLEKLIQEAQSIEDWTVAEKIEFSQKLAGTVDMNMVVTPEVRDYLESQGIGSIDEWKDEKQYLWCVVKNSKVAKTKTGKDYLRLSVIGESGSERGCFVWGYSKNKHAPIDNYTLILARFKKSDFGLSTFYQSIEVLTTR